MIVVEGPDGSGKSTFVTELAKYLCMPVAKKAVGTKMEALTSVSAYVEEAVSKGFHPLIYDRFALISGCIYGPIFGMRDANVAFEDFPWLQQAQRYFQELEPIVIWCLPPLAEVTVNIRSTIDQPIRLKQSQRDINSMYWAYHCRASLESDPIIYDYTRHPMHETFRKIEIALEERE